MAVHVQVKGDTDRQPLGAAPGEGPSFTGVLPLLPPHLLGLGVRQTSGSPARRATLGRLLNRDLVF